MRSRLPVWTTLALALAACAGEASDAPGGADAAGGSSPVLEVGTNTVGEGDFVVLGGGSPLPVVLGEQGSWMLVVALRARDVGELVTAHARVELEVGGALEAKVKVKHQPLDLEAEGWRYLRDIYVVLDAYEALLNQPATLTVELLTTEDELVVTGSADIVIEGVVR